MLFDKSRFPLLQRLEAAYPIFRAELEQLALAEYTPWPDYDAYIGDWRLFLLFLDSYPDSLVVDFEANQLRCPRTMEFLRNEPSVFAAGFSRMAPDCHITPHVDQKPDTQLRAHLGLVVPPGAAFRVGNERCYWKEGEALVFDGLIDHETINQGTAPRTLMMVDFRLSEEELRYTREFMGAIDPSLLISGGGRMA